MVVPEESGVAETDEPEVADNPEPIHEYVLAPLAVSGDEAPRQIDEDELTLRAGDGLAVTATVAEPEQLLVVPVTV